MSVSKDKKSGTWTAQTRYKDALGATHHTTKRGFKTKSAAQRWEAEFLLTMSGSLDMTFSAFCEVYATNERPRRKESTWVTKESIIRTKLLPFFGDKKLKSITARDVVAWENAMRAKGYTDSYLMTLSNQLSAVFNHAKRYYGLSGNPVTKAGKMGSKRPAKEMRIWTPDEYGRFAAAVADKPAAFHAFEVLYWTGLREGELLALMPCNLDLAQGRIKVRHTLWSAPGGRTVLTSPKTPKSKRDVPLPRFLTEELEDYLATLDIGGEDRVFPFTKHFLRYEMQRGCKASGVEPITIHGLRHSHVSLLINQGFSALAIGDRMGHEAQDITLRYAHLFPSVQDDMAAALDEVGRRPL